MRASDLERLVAIHGITVAVDTNFDAYIFTRGTKSIAVPREDLYEECEATIRRTVKILLENPLELVRSYDLPQPYPVRRCGAHGNPDVPPGPCTCLW